MILFNTRMRPEIVQPFWAALQAAEFITAAAQGVGTHRVKGRRWIRAENGIGPRRGGT
jgi:IS30 family transposase